MGRTWYIDHQSGNANSSGDSLNITQSGTDCTISGTALSITGGGLTGKAGRTISYNSAGTYKVATILSVQSDTTATLTALDALVNVAGVQYYIGGAWLGMASVTALRVFPGDAVRCKKSPAPTSLGANLGSWTQQGKTVVLDSAVAATIDLCDTAWTQGTNVTQAQSTTTKKEGAAAQQFTTAAGFTTGSIATHAVTPGDLSGYQQVCFWFRANTTALAAGDLSIRLRHGVTVRNTINLPAIPITAYWVPVVVDTGGALGSDIDTIELFANVTQASKVYAIDNIFASKASASVDSLTLNSLISKSSLDQGTKTSEGWYAIDSIVGATVSLRGYQSANASAFLGYPFTTERVTLYKREPFRIVAVEVPASIAGGSSGNYVSYSGGWDTTNMSTQTGETWLNQYVNKNTNCFSSAGAYHSWDRFGCVSGNIAFLAAFSCSYGRFSNISSAGGEILGIGSFSGAGIVSIDNLLAIGANGLGIGLNFSQYIGTVRGIACATYGVGFSAPMTARNVQGYCCGVQGINLQPGVFVENAQTNFNVAGAFSTNGNASVRNAVVGDAVVVVVGSTLINQSVGFENYNGVAGDTRYFSDSWLAQTDTTVKHGSTSLSWKLQPLSATVRVVEYPGVLPLGAIAVNANTTYTITAWFARNSSGIFPTLVCVGGQLSGIADADVTASMTALPKTILGATNASPSVINVTGHGYSDGDAIVINGVLGNTAVNVSGFVKNVDADHFSLYSDSALTVPVAGNGAYTSGGTVCKWEQLSISVTPTENGVINVEARAYGGATNAAWVSDLGVA